MAAGCPRACSHVLASSTDFRASGSTACIALPMFLMLQCGRRLRELGTHLCCRMVLMVW